MSKKHTEPSLDFLDSSEHFIPIHMEFLLEKVLQDPDLSAQDGETLRTFLEMLQEHYHIEYHRDFLQMKQLFTPFDPDSEAVFLPTFSEEYRTECSSRLMAFLEKFLRVGNYLCLTDEQLTECLKLQPANLRLAVDAKKFDFFQVYYRGVRNQTETTRKWYFWETRRPFKEMKRVVVLTRYKPEFGGKIIIKLFRNIPVECLRVTIPEVRLQLPLFAWLKVGGTFAGSITMPLVKLLAAAVMSFFAFFVFLGLFLVGCFKSFTGLMNSHTKCLQIYSSNLCHKSLSNNVAALNLLVDQAETQEIKEAFLAYYALYAGRKNPMTEKELDAWVEAWLLRNFDFPIDFEVKDALRKLVKLRLVETSRRDSDGETVYHVYDLHRALRRLDEIWDSLHTQNNEENAAGDTLA